MRLAGIASAIVIAVTAGSASAQEAYGRVVVEWTNYNGWADGARGERQTFGPPLQETMSAHFERRSGLVHLRVCNNGRQTWVGVLEMSDDYTWEQDGAKVVDVGACIWLQFALNPETHKYHLLALPTNGVWPN